MNFFEKKNTELIKEFNCYIREHPELAEQIPDDAIVIMQLEGDEEFNRWARGLAESHRGERYPLVFIRIKELRPIRSRIERLELEKAG